MRMEEADCGLTGSHTIGCGINDSRAQMPNPAPEVFAEGKVLTRGECSGAASPLAWPTNALPLPLMHTCMARTCPCFVQNSGILHVSRAEMRRGGITLLRVSTRAPEIPAFRRCLLPNVT